MRPSRRINFTIGEWIAVIVVIAGLLTVPQLRTTTEIAFAVCFIVAGPGLLFASILTELVIGIRCPGCARWTLRRLAMADSYYGCSACRRRYKRFGSGPWLDASGPEDAAMYSGPSASKPWLGYMVPDESSDTTTGSLLRSKKRRGRWGRTLGAQAQAWSRAFGNVTRTRRAPSAGSTIRREPGETTSGLLLRSKKQRHAS